MLREVISNEWITILIVICITILTIVKFSYSKRFNDFLWIILNSNYLKIYFKDNKFIDNFNILLFANQIIGVFIFVYLIISIYIYSFNIKHTHTNKSSCLIHILDFRYSTAILGINY